MPSLGTLSFQSNDDTDVFLVAEIINSQSFPSDDSVLGYSLEDLEIQPVWVTGRLPQKTEVTVEGDTTCLHCLYRTDIPRMFEMTIYIEYEEIEELTEEELVDEEEKPKEIFL
ncbi:MAG: hypothetical protein JWO58_2837 [Chitinophagaceae bacterium]|nr:hypothetical protein [Chitinophagaceae bacterium]